MISSAVVTFSLFLAIACESVEAEPIQIRVLDGRNGRVVPGARLHIWKNQRIAADLINLTADGSGVIQFTVPAGSLLFLQADSYVDCRISKRTAGDNVSYSVSELLETGVAAVNVCGKAKAKAKPGELIVFVRPQHWWDRFKDFG
jgi:hypothetical protein